MADITILTDGQGNGDRGGENRRTVTLGTTIYYFYNDAGGAVNYVKSTDSGATWDAPIEFHSLAGHISCWYDRWTPGDTGNLIHVSVFRYTGNTTFYITLDTSDDSISTAVQVHDFTLNGAANNNKISITKAKAGNLYIAEINIVNEHFFKRSTDGGATWTSRTSPYEAAAVDSVILLPASNPDDDNDVQCIFEDGVGDANPVITLKVYDDSANSWSESATIVTLDDPGNVPQHMALTLRHSDEHLITVLLTDTVLVRDLRVWDINGTGSIVEKTAVISDIVDIRGVSIAIDQNTDDLYVFWSLSPTAANPIVFKKSTDGATTWGTQQAYSETDRVYRALDVDISVGGQGGFVAPCMWDNTALDVWFNVGNAVVIAAGAAGPRRRSQIGLGLIRRNVVG